MRVNLQIGIPDRAQRRMLREPLEPAMPEVTDTLAWRLRRVEQQRQRPIDLIGFPDDLTK
ncbi:hypothetical protein OWT26_36655 [Burkholderia sp. 1A5]